MDRYAVIGHPVEHSLSPAIHHAFAKQTGQQLRFCKLPAPVDGFRAAAQSFFATGGLGLSVTLPFKGEAFDWVAAARGAALRARAVNCIHLQDGRTLGCNTDGEGLIRDLQALGVEIAGRRLLVLGAGGAVQGILGDLIDAGAGPILIANRTAARARVLPARFPGRVEAVALDDLQPRFDLILNGTSAGLQGRGDLIDPALARGAACYDLMYARDGATPFCRWAHAAGAASVADGLGMLVEQAAAAFAIWRGVRPDARAVLAWLRRPGPIGRVD